MSSFFTAPASQRKRKRVDKPTSHPARNQDSTRSNFARSTEPRQIKRVERDESISGSDSEIEEDEIFSEDAASQSSEDEEETAADKRLKLAERYLDTLKETIDPTGFDAAEIDRDMIAERLKEDAAESKGKIYRHIGSTLSFPTATHTTFRSDQFALTAVAVVAPYAYTVAKDLTVCKWELADPSTASKQKGSNITPRRKPKLLKTFSSSRKWAKRNSQVKGHTAPILCAAASQSGKFLVTGGADKKIVVWDTESLKPIKVFVQHRDTVFALSFRRNTHTLYSASADRTIKIWNLDVMTYVETLFGHEDKIVDIVGLASEKCISVGARDRSARLWKVIEESQLVFRGGGMGTAAEDGKIYAEGSIDCVAMIDEETFVTGSDNGSICLWNVMRKKPVFTVPLAHGADPFPDPDLDGGEVETKDARPQARWITALATVPYSDLILSGSWDGFIRAWKISEDRRRLERVGVVGKEFEVYTNGHGPMTNGDHHDHLISTPSVRGLISSMALFERGDRGKDGLCIVAAVSKEHRLGKWNKTPKGRNEAIVFEVGKIPE